MKNELLGWRDARLSLRHREFYGVDCPMTDADLIAVAYAHAIPVAIIEYKFATRAIHQLKNTTNIQALKRLADMAGLPAWVAYYNVESWSYQIICLNKMAAATFGDETSIFLTERDYVETLHLLRGTPPPASVLACLNDTLNHVKPSDHCGPYGLSPARWKKALRPNGALRPTAKRLSQSPM